MATVNPDPTAPLCADDIEQIVEGIEHFVIGGDDDLIPLWQPYVDKLREQQQVLVAAAELLDALNLAVATIRTWHGMGMGPAEAEAWFLYQNSPEMKRINAAIAKAEGR